MSTTIGRGLAWTGAAGVAMGLLDVVATLVLLRFWLSPAEYGIAAVITPLFPMFDLMADAGFSAAVVQHDDDDPATVDTAFWAGCGASAVVALGLCGVGPLLATLHGHELLTLLVPAYAGKLALWNLVAIPTARLRRHHRFATVAKIRVTGALAEFAGKLVTAAAGLGVWCFVIGQVAKAAAAALATAIATGFRPRRRFDRAALARMWRFGRRNSSSQVLVHLYTNADYQIVALAFGPAATGLYRAAYELVLEPTKLLSYIVVEVAFPVFARLRHDAAAAARQLLDFTRGNLVVLVPVLSTLLLAPGDWLELFYGPGWRPAAGAVTILGAVGGLRALSYLLPPVLDGLGRADLTLRYTAVAAVAVPLTQVAAAAALGSALGWTSVALAWAVGYPIAFAVLLALTLGEVALPIRRYLASVLPVLGLGASGVLAGAAVAVPVADLVLPVRLTAITAAVVTADALAWRLAGLTRPRS